MELHDALVIQCDKFEELNALLLFALRQMVANSEADGKTYRNCHKYALAAIAKAEGY